MQIQSSRLTGPNAGKATQTQPTPTNADSSESAPSDSFDFTAEEIVTKGAFAAGGALGGVGLGVVTGNIMNSIANTSISTGVGGTLGGIGGAITALAISDSDKKGQSMLRVFGGWAGSSAGSLAGQYVIGGLGQAMSAAGAAPWIGSIAPLLGTAVGGLGGAALPLQGAEGKVAELVTDSAMTGLAGTAGIGIGGIMQLMVNGAAPVLGPAAEVAPALGAAALGSLVLATRKENNEVINATGATFVGAGIGYTLGMVAGGIANALGASPVAALAAPASGLIAGGLGGYTVSELPGHKFAEKAGVTAGLTGLGTVVGDIGGNVLTAITGNEIYSQFGTAVGAGNGLLVGLSVGDVDTHKAAPSLFGGTAGIATGALLGTALSALTGQETWKVVMPVLGGVAGGLSGAAAAFQVEKSEES